MNPQKHFILRFFLSHDLILFIFLFDLLNPLGPSSEGTSGFGSLDNTFMIEPRANDIMVEASVMTLYGMLTSASGKLISILSE